jgi:hypothetical protein
VILSVITLDADTESVTSVVNVPSFANIESVRMFTDRLDRTNESCAVGNVDTVYICLGRIVRNSRRRVEMVEYL